jgi:2-isopropylmalate synthase
MTKIETYDATLRDGMQGEGMSLTAAEKVRVVHKLDALGIDLIEAGFPASNPKELELFSLLAGEQLQHAQIVAFGMTRRRDVAAADDPALKILAECFAPVCTIVGKTWRLHLEKVVRVAPPENLELIADSVAYLAGAGKRVIYDSEHFFDGYRDDPEYSLSCLRAAVGAGAERVVLCDTNGSSLPDQIAQAVREVRSTLGEEVALGVHCHNDLECGVANTMAAVAEGVTQVQGTMNGIGERTGNANLVTIIANLELRRGLDLIGPERITKLTETAHFVDELLNRSPDPRAAWVGRSAFAHKGGLHAAGVQVDPATFEHSEPSLVGNARDLLISELAGRHAIIEKAQTVGIDLDDDTARRVVDRIKDLEHQGFEFESAEGSVELLLLKEVGEYEPLFRLESWRVTVEQHLDGLVTAEAVVKIWRDDERYVQHAEGNGPLNALDAALRGAIVQVHPHLNEVELVNFKVRILDQEHGTGAVTRVLLDSRDGPHVWGFSAVHENVIAAAWQALVDSLEFAEQRRPAEVRSS